jgi:ankyrin repeat protein
MDPNHPSFLFYSQRLFLACDEGSIPDVRDAVKRGADVRKKMLYFIKNKRFSYPLPGEKELPQDWTPLSIACMKGHTEVVKLLISLGAPVDYRSLNLSASAGYADVFALLLDAGAYGLFEKHGDNPLSYVCDVLYPTDGHLEIVSQLHRAGANINQIYHAGTTSRRYLEEIFLTPLAGACMNGCKPLVSLLLSLGANIHNNIAMGSTTTPLYSAAQNGHAELVSLLLAAGADCDEALPSDGTTPLHSACRANHVDIARELLLAGASIAVVDKHGNTPLDLAGNNVTRAAVSALQPSRAHALTALRQITKVTRLSPALANIVVAYRIVQREGLYLDLVGEYLANRRLGLYKSAKVCGFPSCSHVLKEKQKKCKLCKVVYYCDKHCYTQHWQEHKRVCKMSKEVLI